MTCKQPHGPLARQRGAATLILAVIILLLMTIVVIYTAKVGMLELKTSSNTVRAKEAHYVAQAGLDYAIGQYTASNSLATYTQTLPLSTSGGLANFSVTGSSTASDFIQFRSTGNGPDGTATAVVEEQYGFVPVASFGSIPPLMANGNFDPTGNITIIANPNGAGTGVPVSGWVDTIASGSSAGGSFESCERDEYLFGGNNGSKSKVAYPNDVSPEFYTCDMCACDTDAGKLCEGKTALVDGECSDFAEEPVDGVPNTFEALFRVPETDWMSIRDIALEVACGDLDPNVGDPLYDADDNPIKPPIIWVNGDCTVGDDVGSYSRPVIVVIDGDTTINSNHKIWGVLLAFENPDSGTSINVQLNGGPTFFGSILTNSDVNLGNGAFTLYYAPTVLDKLSNDGAGYTIPARKPGSWKDY